MEKSLIQYSKKQHSGLYLWAGIVALFIVFAGFARTFYLKGIFATPELSNLLIVHGVLMTMWFGFFIVQVSLNYAGRNDLHRRAGLIGAVLAMFLVILGVMVTIESGRSGVSPVPDVPAFVFMSVPLFDIGIFAAFVLAAVFLRRKPEAHKRLMLLATLSILTAPIARIPLAFIEQGNIILFFGIMVLLVLAALAIDTWKHRKLHPVMAVGAGIIIISVPLRLIIANTEPWMQLMGWLTR